MANKSTWKANRYCSINRYRRSNKGLGKSSTLSLAQWCEAIQETRVTSAMNNEERLFIKSNRGAGCCWVRTVPLQWKNWEMKPRQWLVAVKMRLHLRVTTRKGKCVACRTGRTDVHGEHQVTCAGRRRPIYKMLLR